MVFSGHKDENQDRNFISLPAIWVCTGFINLRIRSGVNGNKTFGSKKPSPGSSTFTVTHKTVKYNFPQNIFTEYTCFIKISLT